MRLLPLAAALAFALAGPAAAHQIKAGSLILHHPWARATPPGAQVGGGYVVIENTGDTPDRLVGGSIEAATGFEIHEMSVKDGVMTMRPVPGGVEIPPHAKVEFKPGAFHLMFPGLKQPLTEDTEVDGTFVFEKAGTVKVEFEVQGMGAKGPEEKMPAHQHGAGG